MSDADKNQDFIDMVEQEINCTVCGNYMGHIVVKKEAAFDNKLVDALNLFANASAVEVVCPTCWITRVEKRDFHRIDK